MNYYVVLHCAFKFIRSRNALNHGSKKTLETFTGSPFVP